MQTANSFVNFEKIVPKEIGQEMNVEEDLIEESKHAIESVDDMKK